MEPYDETRREAQQVEYRQALADFLKTKGWHYFFTITFRAQRKNPITALRNICDNIDSMAAGRAFVAIEPHKSGFLHAHGLLKSPSVEPFHSARAYYLGFFRRFGISKVENVRSRQAVSDYCSKYVVKGPDFDYSFVGTHEMWNW